MTDDLILLVEDDPRDEELALRALSKNRPSCRVDVARDGAEALDYLFRRGAHAERAAEELPTVVLLDLKIPKIDGFEVLRRIRADERTRLLPVVILTSSTEARDRCEGYGAGANSYIRKPVDFIEFAAAVERLEHYWLDLNERPPLGGVVDGS